MPTPMTALYGQSSGSTQIGQMGKALTDSFLLHASDANASGITEWTAADGNPMNTNPRNRIYPAIGITAMNTEITKVTKAEDRRSICIAHADCDAPRHKCMEDHLINIWLGYNRYQKAQMLMTLSSGWSILAQLGRAIIGHACVNTTLEGMKEVNHSMKANISWSGYVLNEAKSKLSHDSIREDAMAWVDYIDSTIKEGTGLLTLHRITQLFEDAKHLKTDVQDLVDRYNTPPSLVSAFSLAGIEPNKRDDVHDVSYVIAEDKSVCVLLATNFQPRKLKLSRYLKNLGYSDKVVRDILNVLRGEGFTLEIATDEDIITEGYQGAYSSSCMRHAPERFGFDGGCEIHPSAVYADCPSVAVAFLRNPTGDVVSRTVVSRDKATYSVVYGHPLIESMLKAEGYTDCTETLQGERIRKIAQGSGYVLPYLDGDYRHVESLNDTFWECGTDGQCSNDDGGIYIHDMACCDYCDNDEPAVDMETVRGTDGEPEQWCPDCVTNRATDVGGNSRYEYTHDDNLMEVIDERGDTASICKHSETALDAYCYSEFNDEYVHCNYVDKYREIHKLNEDMDDEVADNGGDDE